MFPLPVAAVGGAVDELLALVPAVGGVAFAIGGALTGIPAGAAVGSVALGVAPAFARLALLIWVALFSRFCLVAGFTCTGVLFDPGGGPCGPNSAGIPCGSGIVDAFDMGIGPADDVVVWAP